MRIVFFGTPKFAVPTLTRLLAAPTVEVLGVVTQPDRPQGRGQKLTPSPIKQLAQQHGLPVWQPERLRRDAGVLDELEALGADFFIVVAYGQILPERVLAMPVQGCINVHASLLPKYRGAAPINWAIYHGETQTGATTMLMDVGLDTGPMLRKVLVPIGPRTNCEQLALTLSEIGARLLSDTLMHFEDIVPQPQDDVESSQAPLIHKEQYPIDWQQSGRQITNQVRAFYPYVFTYHRSERLRVRDCYLLDQLRTDSKDLMPGTVINIIKESGIEVSTGDGVLLLTEVQPAGARVQSAWDYANGCHLVAGESLGSDGPTTGVT